jgi:hypothetical protein
VWIAGALACDFWLDRTWSAGLDPALTRSRAITRSPDLFSVVGFLDFPISAILAIMAILAIFHVSVVGFPITRSRAITGSPDLPSQFHYVQRTILPIVLPTHNHVALVSPVFVLLEVPALKFKFNPHALPYPGRYLAHGNAIREARLQPMHHKPQLPRHHAKHKHHTQLIRWLVRQFPPGQRRTIDWTVPQNPAFAEPLFPAMVSFLGRWPCH